MEKKAYIDKFSAIYKSIPDQKKAGELIDRLSDVLCMMDECKEHIDIDGCVTEMCQGSYSIQRENPWSKVFDAKAKIMVTLIDKLDKMLPVEKTHEDDEMLEFLRTR